MGLINFKDIDFKKSINNENKIINFNGTEIQILNYLPIHDKNDLIIISLQKSFENNIYNYHKLKMYFELHLIYLYTNIVFDADSRADEEGLYDNLKKSGLLDLVINEISKDERCQLWEDVLNVKYDMEKYNNSFVAFISNSIDDLGDKVTKGIEMIKSLNIEETLKKNPQILQLLQTNLNAATAE